MSAASASPGNARTLLGAVALPDPVRRSQVSPMPKELKGRKFYLGLLVAGVPLASSFFLWWSLPPMLPAGHGEPLRLSLRSGAFETLYYCGDAVPKGVIVLGSGDGGWSCWEEKVARHFAHDGYAVGCWDCRQFADSRHYDQQALAEGWKAVAQAVISRSRASSSVPVWYAGWSMGAEQAVAAAASAGHAPHLVGLLLAAPGARGRYGVIPADLLGKSPRGDGSFALADLAPMLGDLPVAQFAAGKDPLDDTSWLQAAAQLRHRIYQLPDVCHDMGGAGIAFQNALDQALDWTLQPTVARGR